MFSAAAQLRRAAAAGLFATFWRRVHRFTTCSGAQPRLTNRALALRRAARRRFRACHVPKAHGPSRACSRRDATRPCMPSATAARAGAVAQAVAPQHRPLAATSTSTPGASRTPCLVRRVRQSPGDATDCDTSASRPRLAHDRVVHVECRLPLQLRRDRAAGLPSALAQPHPLRKAIATFLPDGRSATPENQTWRETLRSVRC